MNIGISLHIGINHPDPAAYGKGVDDLKSAEKTSLAMCEVARSSGFWTKHVLTKDATANHILSQIQSAAFTLASNDIFLLTYAGHGSQIPDTNSDEEDGFDETWVAYDRMIVDDELLWLWSQFQPGVRILMISDSCHSGTISSIMQANLKSKGKAKYDSGISAQLPPEIALQMYCNNKRYYESVQKRADGIIPDCTVLSLSACQDDQITTYDPQQGGLFTNRLLTVWKNGAFQGSYRQFFKSISDIFGVEGRNPNYRVIGVPRYDFEDQRPFSI